MVFYIINTAIDPPVTYFMGKDKYENEDLIKWGWPEDLWFHVDKLSSAHVYMRLNPGQTINDVPQQAIDDACQLVKSNSIEGCKLNKVDVVYTMWSNLKKTPGMEVGQIGFHNENEVRKMKVEKQTDVVKRLNKTKTEEYPVDLREQRERRDAQEKAKQEKLYREKKQLEKVEQERRKEEAELRSYSSLMKSDKMTDNKSGYDPDDFW